MLQTDWRDEAVAETARANKERAYPELASGNRCLLVVLAIEVGGRFSQETGEFLKHLAMARSQTTPKFLQASSVAAFERRWIRMLAVSAASAHAASVLLEKAELEADGPVVGRQPWLQNLIAECGGSFHLATRGCRSRRFCGGKQEEVL